MHNKIVSQPLSSPQTKGALLGLCVYAVANAVRIRSLKKRIIRAEAMNEYNFMTIKSLMYLHAASMAQTEEESSKFMEDAEVALKLSKIVIENFGL